MPTRILWALFYGWLFAGSLAASELVEIQRLFDQAGERPSSIVVSPDGNHFYVIGAAGLTAHSLFPSGATSPRVQTLRGFDGGERIDQIRQAIFSPDGRYLYAIRPAQILAFERNAATGEIALVAHLELPQVTEGQSEFARVITMTRDGRHIYVAGSQHVTALQRDNSSGALQIINRWQYLTTNSIGSDIALSPDESELIALGELRAITVFSRTALSGELTEKQILNVPGRGGVVYLGADALAVGSRATDTLIDVYKRSDSTTDYAIAVSVMVADVPVNVRQPRNLTVSPDGLQLYGNGHNTNLIHRFAVEAEQSLTFLASQDLIATPDSLVLTGDGQRLLVTNSSNDEWAIMDRDPVDGALSLDPNQRYNGAPNGFQGLAGAELEMSPGGTTLIARSPGDAALVIFDVLSDGRLVLDQTLSEAAGAADNRSMAFGATDSRFYVTNQADISIDIWERNSGAEPWIQRTGYSLATPLDGENFLPTYPVASADGAFLYVLGFNGFDPNNAAIVTFSIDNTGDLVFDQMIDLSSGGRYPYDLVVSQDQRFVYSFNFIAGAPVYAFERDTNSGTLSLVGTFAAGGQHYTGVPLAGGRVLVSDRALPGLQLLGPSNNNQLPLDQQFVASMDLPGIDGTWLLKQIPASRRILAFGFGESPLHGMFELDANDQPNHIGAINLPQFGFPTAAAFSPDGRFAYLSSSTLNAITVHRIEGIFRNDFERAKSGSEVPMTP